MFRETTSEEIYRTLAATETGTHEVTLQEVQNMIEMDGKELET